MDKTKTLEVLRGMKFMQRKEEARRWELFEANQRRALKEQLHLAAAGDSGGDNSSNVKDSKGTGSAAVAFSPHSESGLAQRPRSATVFYDMGFPRELYTFARRTFTPRAKLPCDSSCAAATTADSACYGEEQVVGGEEERSSQNDLDCCDDEGDDCVDDPTAVDNSVVNERRFCVNLRAPLLPKSLERRIYVEKQAKRLREKDKKTEKNDLETKKKRKEK